MPGPSIALVHDYLTQRGGAERVALLLANTFPSAPLHTSLYEPAATFPEFADVDVRTLPINRIGPFRRHHRLAFPALAPSFSALRVDADVVICSSSGWAHGPRVSGHKIVYCHAPARWLYQTARYVGTSNPAGPRAMGVVRPRSGRSWRMTTGTAVRTLGPLLRRWDRNAAATADRYIANSRATARLVQDVYGIEAQIVPPPPALGPNGPEAPIAGVEPGYFLCVSRLIPYKNVDVVIDAVKRIPGARLVVVGDGPVRPVLETVAGPSVLFVGKVDDSVLRWLYRNATALVAASYEDYGLTPLEAASFGRPAVVLRAGGFLDTVVEGKTGLFFDDITVPSIVAALRDVTVTPWDAYTMTNHAMTFSMESFQERIRRAVSDVSS